MKALIFGANGQDGHYLSESCLRRDIEVIGVSRSGPWIQGDVACADFVEELIGRHKPSLIFHLAAESTTRHEVIFDNHATIGTGALNILEAVKKNRSETKVFIAGSGLQFINQGRPISERDPFDHSSAYVAVRNYSVYLARYFRGLGIPAYVGYLFHHESPRRGPHHVCQKISQAVRRISEGREEVIMLGDLSVKKEWAYAGDIAEGILALVMQDRVFEAAIGSGCAYSIEDWLNECFKLINRDWKSYVRAEKNFQAEYDLLVSNPATINALGWHASTNLSGLARIMMGL